MNKISRSWKYFDGIGNAGAIERVKKSLLKLGLIVSPIASPY
jgi:hypothetical protein